MAQNDNKDGGNGNQNLGVNSVPNESNENAKMEIDPPLKTDQPMQGEGTTPNSNNEPSNSLEIAGNTVNQNPPKKREGKPRGPYKKRNPDQVPKKKGKRGRKKKTRNIHDDSSESDTDLFNYDKFLKRVSK